MLQSRGAKRSKSEGSSTSNGSGGPSGNRSFALRTVRFPIFLHSANGTIVSGTNIAHMNFSMQDTPMHIPNHAIDVHAYVTQLANPRHPTIRYFSVESNFVIGGHGVDGKTNMSLYQGYSTVSTSDLPVERKTIDIPLKVHCNDNLKGTDINNLEIRFVDQSRTLLDYSDSDAEFFMTIVVEWQEEIELDRLRSSGTETRHR